MKWGRDCRHGNPYQTLFADRRRLLERTSARDDTHRSMEKVERARARAWQPMTWSKSD